MALELLNINGEDGDEFYRYKMPAIISQSLNNNTTIILNIDDISKSLNRDSVEIISFMKKKLNVGGNKSSISGKWSKQDLQKIIQIYIKENILCRSCGNPETIVEIKNKHKYQKCIACGCKNILN